MPKRLKNCVCPTCVWCDDSPTPSHFMVTIAGLDGSSPRTVPPEEFECAMPEEFVIAGADGTWMLPCVRVPEYPDECIWRLYNGGTITDTTTGKVYPLVIEIGIADGFFLIGIFYDTLDLEAPKSIWNNYRYTESGLCETVGSDLGDESIESCVEEYIAVDFEPI